MLEHPLGARTPLLVPAEPWQSQRCLRIEMPCRDLDVLGHGLNSLRIAGHQYPIGWHKRLQALLYFRLDMIEGYKYGRHLYTP